MIHITAHAIERYQERVADLPAEVVRALLSSPAVLAAVRFGAPFVKLGSGHRLVLVSNRIVTVLSKDQSVGCMSWDAHHRRVQRYG